MSALVHHPSVVKNGRGWSIVCTCGRDDINVAPVTKKTTAVEYAERHRNVMRATGGEASA